ncbi:MAG: mechanosensitive ion channel [Planctomycetes bacterium]|nr:mechanosensitive ion channel [Planctomycetota bacterium]
MTATILLLVGGDGAAAESDPNPAERAEGLPSDAAEGFEQATSTIMQLATSVYALLPKLMLALLLLVLAWAVAWLVQKTLRRVLRSWHRTEAVSALVRIALYIAAAAGGMAVLAGDARALLGSVGLVGLALSWALQTPIESFTGWLLNSFRGYYRVGDRIEVGEVFGDVYKIDVLTTTVWEAGGPGKAVRAAQPTGAMITFPNWEVLRSNIINYTREFPFVWDEVAIGVSNESDLAYAAEVIGGVARTVIGPTMEGPAAEYQELLQRARLAFDVEELPKVFLAQTDSWTDCIVRYLVPTRQRRRWSSELILALSRELARPAHQGRIVASYPRQEVRLRESWRPGADAAGADGPT